MRRGITCYLQEDGRWVVNHEGKNIMRMGDMDEETREKLGVMLLCPVGYDDPEVGKKISEEVFWVYVDR